MRWFLLLLVTVVVCKAEVIDRVAVVVGNGVITESEILREIRLTACLNGEPLDFSPAQKRKTAQRLVEQHLIRAESGASSYPQPDPEEVEQLLKQARDRFASPDEFKNELERVGVTEDEVRAHLARQLATLGFLDFRFRPGIQISDDEITKYFNERLVPELKKKDPGKEFSVDNYRLQIEQALIGERLDKASDTWLKDAHDRTRIEYRSAVFAPEAKQEASK